MQHLVNVHCKPCLLYGADVIKNTIKPKLRTYMATMKQITDGLALS